MIESNNSLSLLHPRFKFFRFTIKEVERFWNNVSVFDSSNCWDWKLRKSKHGYGKVTFRSKSFPAHRLAFALTWGFIDNEKLVCHKCDNPLCCNPSHLFLGTQKENILDMMSKNRHRNRRGGSHKGELHPSRKLSDKDVIEIRRLKGSGQYLNKDLSRLFSVSKTTIAYIVRRKSWKHL